MEDLILHRTRTGDVVGSKEIPPSTIINIQVKIHRSKTDIISQKQNGKNWKSYEVKNCLVKQIICTKNYWCKTLKQNSLNENIFLKLFCLVKRKFLHSFFRLVTCVLNRYWRLFSLIWTSVFLPPEFEDKICFIYKKEIGKSWRR